MAEMSKSIMEINTPFKALLATLNSLLEVLNKLDYRIYDANDSDYYILAISYNDKEDKLEIIWGEDE
jgi:hypothetical protein